jgi:hypothetical protein
MEHEKMMKQRRNMINYTAGYRRREEVLKRAVYTGSNKLFLEQNYGKSYKVGLLVRKQMRGSNDMLS